MGWIRSVNSVGLIQYEFKPELDKAYKVGFKKLIGLIWLEPDNPILLSKLTYNIIITYRVEYGLVTYLIELSVQHNKTWNMLYISFSQ